MCVHKIPSVGMQISSRVRVKFHTVYVKFPPCARKNSHCVRKNSHVCEYSMDSV
jgi:hypothetical protein